MTASSDPGGSRAMRSLLLVRADRPAAVAEALASGADALVLDLTGPAEGRRAAAAFFQGRRPPESGPLIFTRVSLDEARIDADLDAAMPGAPDGIIVSGAVGSAAVALLGARIAAREAIIGIDDGETAVAIIISTAAGLAAAGGLRRASRRLKALAWDAEALAADLGAPSSRDADGVLIEPLRVARSLCLAAAAAAGIAAIDTAFGGGLGTLREEALAARRFGYTGKLAARADQVSLLNGIFSGAMGGLAGRP